MDLTVIVCFFLSNTRVRNVSNTHTFQLKLMSTESFKSVVNM